MVAGTATFDQEGKVMFGTDLWTFAVIGGPVILLLVIIYALATRRRRGLVERRESDRGAERLYREQKD
ncbi:MULTISPECIES: hypothetical protein [unclassified Mesorhizobium]|uniref:hypothetical protein n=2 Tax=unclassified Mesorhizobium TaxID=325217 RepID=UPI000F7640AA|nr:MULTISPECIES: hypothetical protein [unclassified Mesorhizobium]TGT58586.1 hypothetical protein EN813_031525 [Mesorhizobium sp. M00.F.Ca.ET.170.01.1.1]AZO12050.1 hypothetical protein EJ074_25280 [Mesorhizobium sp. M3A.F.Ca.ET.080.04.2.1]RWB74768.1 MAG: hypothetical protein EOQ49_05135 [Mesorhizobium sp.]RWB89773.1 MAG: hypothetical protein EOQ52_11750 [Mesorhizobium sp.]TGS86438.1 hypothetical protein EN818_13935 [Mesorhizobium sp. M3A.F.Ca.ET.175.01.1.1]